MAHPIAAIKPAIITKLRADTTLRGLLAGLLNTSVPVAPAWNVFDNVVENQTFPYIRIGEFTSTPDLDVIGPINGHATIITIHGFSQYYGTKELDGIMSRVDDLLNKKSLTLAAPFTFVGTWFNDPLPVPTPETDGITRHAAYRYRILTQGG